MHRLFVHGEARPLLKVVALVSLSCLIMSGRYNVRVIAPHPDPATEYKQRTTNTLAWGLIKEDVAANDCAASNAVDEVRVSSNFGNSLLTVFTLGFWSRTTVQWRCSKPHEQTDTISSIGAINASAVHQNG